MEKRDREGMKNQLFNIHRMLRLSEAEKWKIIIAEMKFSPHVDDMPTLMLLVLTAR